MSLQKGPTTLCDFLGVKVEAEAVQVLINHHLHTAWFFDCKGRGEAVLLWTPILLISRKSVKWTRRTALCVACHVFFMPSTAEAQPGRLHIHVCTCMIITPSDVIYYLHNDQTKNSNKTACKTCFKAQNVICNLRCVCKNWKFCETSPKIAEATQLNPGSHPGTSRSHRKTTPVVTSHFILTTSPFSLGQNRK